MATLYLAFSNSNPPPKPGDLDIDLITTLAFKGDLQELSRLLTRENVNEKDSYSETPLMAAAQAGHIHIVRYLIEVLGADIFIKNKCHLTVVETLRILISDTPPDTRRAKQTAVLDYLLAYSEEKPSPLEERANRSFPRTGSRNDGSKHLSLIVK